ncbi:MOSC domain-containing protein [Streptomyces phaeochromogenes]|uniref:MOSC domain-containing protein n=1 Tax=Streptomyces phaeochromogenes TaxID=1923 RepID=UPI002E2C9264|nr:MOSC domain-containing protein [Streptomyces phaeochromogenes]
MSIINLATVRDIARVAKTPLDPRRFRGNLYVDGLPAWAEFGLLGTGLRIGEVDLHVLRPIERCRATAVDLTTGGTEVNVPGILAAHFGHLHCGIYAQARTPGRLKVGDHVHLGPRRSLPYVSQGLTQGLTRAEIVSAPRPARVTSVSRPTATTTSVEFEDPGPALSTARPGQYLRVHRTDLDAPGWRNYTISRAGDGPSRITAEYREGGVVSPWLSGLHEGEHILVSGPFGDAVVDTDSDRPLLVLTAGIGITPALATAHALVTARSARPVDFGVTAKWPPESGTLLELAESQGLTLPARCRAGVCGTCAAPVQGPTAYLVDPLVESRDGHVLLCTSVPAADIMIDES